MKFTKEKFVPCMNNSSVPDRLQRIRNNRNKLCWVSDFLIDQWRQENQLMYKWVDNFEYFDKFQAKRERVDMRRKLERVK